MDKSFKFFKRNKLKKTIYDNALKELLELKEMAESSDANSNHRFEIILSSKDLNVAVDEAIIKFDLDGPDGMFGRINYVLDLHHIDSRINFLIDFRQ